MIELTGAELRALSVVEREDYFVRLKEWRNQRQGQVKQPKVKERKPYVAPVGVDTGEGTVTKREVVEAFELMGRDGVSLRTACEVLGISFHRAYRLILGSADLRKLERETREIYLRNMVQRLNELVLTEEDVSRVRLICENVKWEASRVLPKEYGDRMVVAGDEENPLLIMHRFNADELERRIRGGGGGTVVEGELVGSKGELVDSKKS